MANNKECPNLIIVHHPEKGDEDTGKAICDKIRKVVSESAGGVCLFHDASGMSIANPSYASEFKDLDKEIKSRVSEIVCAIPGSIPRMMAHTVAMFSDKDWSIFRDVEGALDHLHVRGFEVTADDVKAVTDVELKKR
jgi:hypothetical protein